MSAVLIDGKRIAEQIKAELSERIQALKQKHVTPGLAAVLVGDDPASAVYVGAKAKMCESLGLFSRVYHLEPATSQAALLELLAQLNHDATVHGILVQLPLPPQIDPQRVLAAIAPEKDVDGFTPVNRGKLQSGEETFIPCTPAGVLELLQRSGFPVAGKHVVILGRSGIVGMPLAVLLAQKRPHANATVTICHSATRNVPHFTRQAEILVAAIGKAQFVTADMVQEGVVVIDVGTNRVADPATSRGYRLVGDVDFAAVREKAAAITPVPGGVGPMTIMMLMHNTVLAAERLTAGSV
ncbi:MAG: bifunctional methylenetetrahydrofolate dehydrogenase/methenyltetrahydrofolate cyclohydrolase FolD [candidate division KSB1 bacterium]|nr:bifunctional methylenetetrahydrofolate dehydrogenase/methenyltetrahydrofolate cyclohydrolase FolD [candidate division KSB1 bacterium]MDZ7276472.1 bifunctional methylenetetrahydrofolate dehydrogenase/methenyltetrahydrofolate cyclohydrolase FolD [candidate division KSB1 bacterium]MDZ7286747.1 bifunctional methylenetetrahydrofolate dehydrogenase/methenyltetrahydrofolate cyclohydrolase FolD [candidate division KSB1 bacterium]MDZ7300242.1 bifunctional methylenetetrahydrofolate dehydrogenase/methen